jgi:hypothetical protein
MWLGGIQSLFGRLEGEKFLPLAGKDQNQTVSPETQVGFTVRG